MIMNREKMLKRFNAKYSVDAKTGCWLWTASIGAPKGKDGYGQFTLYLDDGTRKGGAHKAAWLFFRGEIPKGKWVLHKCDVRRCCNPDHLYIGDVKDNVRDAIERGRFVMPPHKTGESHGQSKLTEKEVIEIRKLYETGNFTQRELARKFGVTQPLIGGITRRDIWKLI